MTVTLTTEQSRQLNEADTLMTYAVDPASRRRYVVIGSEAFERMRSAVGEATMQDVLAAVWADAADDTL